MQQSIDFIQGTVFRGHKKDGTPAKFFTLALFEVDPKTEQPIVIGQKTIGKKQYDKHRIVRSFRIAESSLLKMASGESKSCNIYYSLPRGY